MKDMTKRLGDNAHPIKIGIAMPVQNGMVRNAKTITIDKNRRTRALILHNVKALTSATKSGLRRRG